MACITSKIQILGKAIDPIYIGTGGYTIGRVDNTIVRDPINRVPKIPGSSLAGTWRFYSTLYLQGKWIDIEENWCKFEGKEDFITSYVEYLKDSKHYCIDEDEEKLKAELKKVTFKKFILKLRHIFWENDERSWNVFWNDFWNNFVEYIKGKGTEKYLKKVCENSEVIKYSIYSTIYCAGKDEAPQDEIKEEDANKENIKGHCGRCIVCKSFGYSKNADSWQGILFFSDLEIILFPVYTQFGTKFVTTEEKIKYLSNNVRKNDGKKFAYKYDESGNSWINLGWLNIRVKKYEDIKADYELNDGLTIYADDIVVVTDKMFNHVVNANLEVRTSVSIDPIKGTAKDGALFTSEAIPRGTIFYGNLRIFDKSIFGNEISPNIEEVKKMLSSSKCYFETLGIGGLTTRGFGRLEIFLSDREGKGIEEGQNNA